MANLEQVTHQIRFGIEQLSAKSSHHEFEHLCRHLTRAKICSNILPATGPVSAGGDQGRDFETFRTYLNSTSIADSTFIGLASTNPIAFACSLQDKSGISTKIKSDVKEIMSSGSKVESVHYFCGADLAVAKRHKLQEWVREEYEIELEIYDGQAISELLADREVFWIAEKYLSIPSEIFPRSPKDEDETWYSAVFSDWKTKMPTGDNFAEFTEIKVAARHSFYNKDLRQDLSFWIDLLKNNFIDSRLKEIRRRAIYEVCVLTLRGFQTLVGYEELLRTYFSEFSNSDDIFSLEDSEVLLNYCGGAIIRGVLELTRKEISELQQQLKQQIDKKLENEDRPNAKAILYKIKGYSYLTIDPLNPELPKLEEAIDWWLKLTDFLENAPMFPLENFADNTNKLLKIILEMNSEFSIPESYFELTEKLDNLLAKRVGGFAAAENCRKRAFLLRENGRIIDAIDLLHRSKIDWYASETLRQALSMMLFLSSAYAELGLYFAAKNYALAVAFTALQNPQAEVKPLISVGLMRTATSDYLLGAFCSFLNLSEIELLIHSVHAQNAGDLDNNPELQSVVFHLLTLKAVSKRLNPEFGKLISSKIDNWLPKEWIEDIFPIAKQNLQSMSDEQLTEYFASELAGMPFGDLEPYRKVVWSALGVEWNISWENDYETTKQAEQFLAILQIYLAEVAQVDLCLLKTTIEIQIELGTSQEVEEIPSNEKRIWKVTLPQTETLTLEALRKRNIEIFSISIHILLEASLLPQDKYLEIMENLFKKGLSSRIFVAQPYENLYSEFIREEDFNKFDRTLEENSFSDIVVELFEHEELKWNDDLGLTYSWEEAEQHLKNRYSNGSAQFQLAVELLKDSVNFKQIIEQLHEDGWLDWQIMSAITHVAMNYQSNLRAKYVTDRRELEKIWQEVFSGKVKWVTVPMEEFDKDKLLFCLRVSMLSTLKLLGLECHQLTPNLKAIDDFLRYRYNYWTDDVPHEDIFKDLY